MGRQWLKIVCCLVASAPACLQAQDGCPESTLWEPYTEVCAPVRDVRSEFPTGDTPPITLQGIEQMVPGGMATGITYRPDQLVALQSGRLHTRMFVYPYGLEPDGPLPWLFTTATSRVNRGLEVVGIYKGDNPDSGQLGLYAWPCLEDFPCPDGRVSPGWQWYRDFTSLTCNITHAVDQGMHAHQVLYYANHTDRLDDGTPPLYRSAVYLWNYCDDAWDLAWEHTYRQDKVDCSVPGAACAWWGPSLEIFGTDPYPQIAELGYEDSLLYHDGQWSRLGPDEADFRDPMDPRWGSLTPWQLFHREPNSSYGVGNRVNENDAPTITGQVAIETLEDTAITIRDVDLSISDADVDPGFHSAFVVTVFGGTNYNYTDSTVTPAGNFAGELLVPISVNDGAADSPTYDLRIAVLPVNDAPDLLSQQPLETLERTPLEITVDVLDISDPDNAPNEISVSVLDGPGYSHVANAMTPEPGVIGDISINVILTDGLLESPVRQLVVTVIADEEPPQITLIGEERVSITSGSTYRDAGATSIDNVDGDVTDRIVVDNPVNSGVPGTYTIQYTVSDVAGNTATASRIVSVTSATGASSGGGTISTSGLIFLTFLWSINRRRAVRLN